MEYVMIIIAISTLSTLPISAQFPRSNPKLLNPLVNAYKSDPIDNQDQQPYFTNLAQAHLANRARRDITIDYPIVCEIKVTEVELGDSYFPNTYYNKTCSNPRKIPYFIDYSEHIEKTEFCFHDDQVFGCQTLYEDINVIKRSTSDNQDCWEYFTQTVGVGCRCNVKLSLQ